MAVLFLILVFLFHAVADYLWLGENILAPFWDESRHLTIALNYIRFFPSLFLNPEDPFLNLGSPVVYGPVFYFLAGLVSFILGTSRNSLTLTNMVFMAILFFSTFKIGEKVSSKRAGLLSVWILSFYPIVFGLSRMFMLEYALAAMAALSIYWLIMTEDFRNTKFILLMSFTVAVGLLIKLSFPLFILGPLIWVLYHGIREQKPKKVFVHFLIFLIAGIFLPLIWYGLNQTFTRSYFFTLQDAFSYRGGYSELGLVGSLSFYVDGLKKQMSAVGALIFILAAAYSLDAKRARREYGMLALWILVPALIFYSFKEYPRYTAPYLPAMAILSAVWIVENWKKHWIKAISCVFAILGAIQFFIFSFGFMGEKGIVQKSLFPPDALSWIVHPADKSDWRVKEVLEYIRKDTGKTPVSVGLLADTDCINNETFSYYVYAGKFPFKVVRCVDEVREEHFTLDYLITLLDPKSWHWDRRRENVLALDRLLKNEYPSRYKLAQQFKAPKQNRIYLYKKESL